MMLGAKTCLQNKVHNYVMFLQTVQNISQMILNIFLTIQEKQSEIMRFVSNLALVIAPYRINTEKSTLAAATSATVLLHHIVVCLLHILAVLLKEIDRLEQQSAHNKRSFQQQGIFRQQDSSYRQLILPTLFSVYLDSNTITVYSDHSLLQFLHKMAIIIRSYLGGHWSCSSTLQLSSIALVVVTGFQTS